MSLLSQLHAMLGSQLCFKSWTKHTRIRCLGAYGAYTEPLETGKHLESLKSEQSSMGFYGILWDLLAINGILWSKRWYPLVMTNSSPWFFDDPNRNRWFTVLKDGGSFHGELLNSQRVNFMGFYGPSSSLISF